MKTFVVGDIHGAHKALLQVLERSGFNREEDTLISLGDVADGWPQVPECFDELLSIPNLLYIMGNHDYWLMEYLKHRATPRLWTSQGGQATLDAYINYANQSMEDRHLELLLEAPYYLEIDNNVFVHGGFMMSFPIGNQASYELMWDRELWYNAHLFHAQEEVIVPKYDKVFIGHTSTSYERSDLTPVKASNVWNLDQGGGWEGKLTIMNVDTEEYWQSDIVKELYPNVKGR